MHKPFIADKLAMMVYLLRYQGFGWRNNHRIQEEYGPNNVLSKANEVHIL